MSSASLLDTASQAGANGNLRVVQNAQKAARTEFTSTASKSSPNESLASPCLTAEDMDAAAAIISKWEGYAPTALHDLDEVAARVGVRRVLYKDESSRFGLRSFKALGGAYAVAGVAAAHGPNVLPSLTVTSVTDGNHGRSVAWGARRAGCRCVIYIHAAVSVSRENALKELGAEVVRSEGNYDTALKECVAEAEKKGWVLVSDTSWPGCEAKLPMIVMAGYTVMTREIIDKLGDDAKTITHVFVPVGVGGLAAAIALPLWRELGVNTPRIVTVESVHSCCFLESIDAGEATPVDVKEETIMAGLSCGEVSTLAWDMLRPLVSHAAAITDDAVRPLMKYLHAHNIEAGECATSGLATLLQIHENAPEDMKRHIGLGPESVVLLIGCEGATDPDFYAEVTGGNGVHATND